MPHNSLSEMPAAAEERKRLARELHDSLGYTLTVSMVQLENAAKVIGEAPQETRQIIETVRERLATGLDDLHATLTSLRALEIGADMLDAALRKLISEFSATTRTAVQARLPEAAPPLTDAQATTLYRAAQEALVNAVKHGRAETICVTLDIEGSFVVLNVKDDGQQYAPPARSGYGLTGVHERVEQAGGSLVAMRAPEGGFLLTCRLPLKGATYA